MTNRQETTAAPGPRLTRTHWIVLGVVVAGVAVIAGIGFAGSYEAVSRLARKQGFGDFANVFPIGIDAGIVVLLALDLFLTWMRIPFPLLRQIAWLLTAATISFNAAAAWPSPLGVSMHAVIPLLFVVAVEAARHAIGRIADITADRHIEGVRLTRWLLAPISTFRLWRRMQLWEIRSYTEAVGREQERLVYQARLRADYGRSWRRKAPLAERMPLRMARYGMPVTATADATQSATSNATERPEGTPQSATQSAPVAPRTDATERPRGATKPPRRGATERPETGGRGAAKDAIKALYTEHGRRPLESEMVAALVKAKSRHTSRQFANKLRGEIEAAHPELAALGSENVRALTGS